MPLDKLQLFFLFFFSLIFIYLFIYFGCTGSSLWHAGSSLWHVGSLVVAWGLLSCGMQTLSCSTQTLRCSMQTLSRSMLNPSCGMQVGSSFLTRDWTRAPCIGSVESYQLVHQGSPSSFFFFFLLKRNIVRVKQDVKKDFEILSVCVNVMCGYFYLSHLPPLVWVGFRTSYVICMACCKMKTWSLIKKLLRIAGQQQQSIKPSAGTFSVCGPVWLHKPQDREAIPHGFVISQVSSSPSTSWWFTGLWPVHPSFYLSVAIHRTSPASYYPLSRKWGNSWHGVIYQNVSILSFSFI